MSEQTNDIRSGFRKMILLLLISGAAILLIAPVSAGTGITINAIGDRSYYLGEEVRLGGTNEDSTTTFLFITGPGIAGNGGNLAYPLKETVTGMPGSFVMVTTNADKSWDYTLYTNNLGLNPGPYTIYAVGQPKAKDQLGGITSANVSIILKQPFITGTITPPAVVKGQPFTVTGTAEGNMTAVQLWIIGDNFAFNTSVPVNPDPSYTFTGDAQFSGTLPKGQCYLIVQHPMQDTKLDIVESAHWVKNLKMTEGSADGTTLFKIAGAGSLQGTDAAQALVAALTDPSVDDTYTEIPFSVQDAAVTPALTQPVTTAPTPTKTKPSPLLYAPLGAIFLVWGIVVWRRR
jgi:hypothetical protein